MLKRIIKSFVDYIYLRKIDDIKIQKGKIFEFGLQRNLKSIKNIQSTYFKVFSQDFEDGIIQYLLKSLKIYNVRFVEIGTQDYTESNTRYLFETMRCDGLLIDPYPNLEKKIKSFCKTWQNNIKIHNDYINSQNINKILKKYSFEGNLDIFSLDIDGIDYWILKEIKPKISKIFIVEYNPYFGPTKNISAPNIEKYDRFKYHYTGFCFGASLLSIINLMKQKGYTFIGTNRLNCNAFFLQNNLLHKINLKIPNIKDLSKFTNMKFKVLKDKKGNLVSFNEIKNQLRNINVFSINKRKLLKFNKC
jgi:hypothetical protein